MRSLKINIGQVNNKWKRFHAEQFVGLHRHPCLRVSDPIFTMGSCFAEEIRKALSTHGFKMLPDYGHIELDVDRFVIDTLPRRPHMNYYNTFTVLQEVMRGFGRLNLSNEDCWEVPDRLWGECSLIYQDPYKRLVFGKTRQDLREALRRVNAVIDQGLREAKAFVFTFGMAEVFKNKSSGLIVSQRPLYGIGGGELETELHLSTFTENKNNVQAIIDIINSERGNDVEIFLSVSPVPLQRTFSQSDVYMANHAGKSLLRAVLEEVARENERVHYFPSWDLIGSLGPDAFTPEDGRHIKPSVVAQVIEGFVRSYIIRDDSF